MWHRVRGRSCAFLHWEQTRAHTHNADQTTRAGFVLVALGVPRTKRVNICYNHIIWYHCYREACMHKYHLKGTHAGMCRQAAGKHAYIFIVYRCVYIFAYTHTHTHIHAFEVRPKTSLLFLSVSLSYHTTITQFKIKYLLHIERDKLLLYCADKQAHMRTFSTLRLHICACIAKQTPHMVHGTTTFMIMALWSCWYGFSYPWL